MAVRFAPRRLSAAGSRAIMAALAIILCLATYSALPAPPAGALAPPAIDTSATAGVMTGISCPTATFCMAVDLAGNAVVDQSSVWDVTSIDSNPLYAVSCVSATFCVAVDQAGDALAYNGSTWTTTSVDPGNVLDTVSCPTTKFCVAGDTAGNVFLYKSSAWTSYVVDAGHSIDAVSCPTAKACAAVDSSGNLLLYGSSTWKTTSIDGATALYGLSCKGTTFCAAVDSDGHSLTPNGTGASRWTNPQKTEASSVQLDGVSCTSSTFCVAVDNSGGAAIYSGSSWSDSAIDSPNEIDAVSCQSATLCVAVDDAGDALTYNGSAWSEAKVDKVLSGVSCVSTGGSSSFCGAVGENGYLYTTPNEWATVTSALVGGQLNDISCTSATFCVMVANNGEGTVWTGSGSGTSIRVDTKPLNAVSCVTISSVNECWTVDALGDVTEYNGTSWGSPTSIDGRKALKDISCVTDGVNPYCTATDGAGNIVLYNGTSWGSPVDIDSTFDLLSASCSSPSVCDVNDSNGVVFETSNDWSTYSTLHVLTKMGQMSCFNTTDCQALNGPKVYYTTNQWSTKANHKIDTRSMKDISCYGTTNCSAVDVGGYALISDNDWQTTTTVDIE